MARPPTFTAFDAVLQAPGRPEPDPGRPARGPLRSGSHRARLDRHLVRQAGAPLRPDDL